MAYVIGLVSNLKWDRSALPGHCTLGCYGCRRGLESLSTTEAAGYVAQNCHSPHRPCPRRIRGTDGTSLPAKAIETSSPWQSVFHLSLAERFFVDYIRHFRDVAAIVF